MEETKFLNQPDLGKLLLRLSVGFILFLHGLGKIESGIGGTMGLLESNGFPGWLAYGAYLGEFAAPCLLILGKFTRPAGLVLAFNMLMTIVTAHLDIAFQRNEYGGWLIELNVLLMMGGIATALLGAGKYSLSKGLGRWD